MSPGSSISPTGFISRANDLLHPLRRRRRSRSPLRHPHSDPQVKINQQVLKLWGGVEAGAWL